MGFEEKTKRVLKPEYIYIKGYKIYDFYILLVCVLCIIFYGNMLDILSKDDVLAYKFYNRCYDCDYWGIAHFIFFLLLGLLFPENHMRFLLIGCVWELIEGKVGMLEYGDNTIIKLFGGWGMNKNNIETNDWWYGRMSDIVFNTGGYTLGSWISS